MSEISIKYAREISKINQEAKERIEKTKPYCNMSDIFLADEFIVTKLLEDGEKYVESREIRGLS